MFGDDVMCHCYSVETGDSGRGSHEARGTGAEDVVVSHMMYEGKWGRRC